MTVLIQGGNAVELVSVVDAATALDLIHREARRGLGVATVGAGLPERIDAHLAKRGRS